MLQEITALLNRWPVKERKNNAMCMWSLKIVRLISILAFFFIFDTDVGADSTVPLSPQEIDAVVREIQAMVRTREEQVDNFVVQEATPERIDRLYQMPELLQQPKIIRENGLIFAGHGELLKFDRPSDIIAKLSKWFPEEITIAQTKKGNNSFFKYLHLFGPYQYWQAEPAAFLGLWRCMPEKAWLKPEQSFFTQRLDDGFSNPLSAIADRRSGLFDFGQCIHERINDKYAWTDSLPFHQVERREIGNKITPVLQNKFARFLAKNRCQGTGPDDCVLVLLLWSNLSPADPMLAKAIQDLEPEITPDGPLSEALPGIEREDGEPGLDAALRKMAFMRAKQVSVLYAEDGAWPPQSLEMMQNQLANLQLKIINARTYRWNNYHIDEFIRLINSWQMPAPDVGKSSRLQAVAMGKLESHVNDTSCDVINLNRKEVGPVLWNTFALRHLANKPPLRCVYPDWEWLIDGQSAEARDLRSRYLKLLEQIELGVTHERLLRIFTKNGERCFNKDGSHTNDWLNAVCKRWVSEPQAVPFALKHSRLTLSDAKKFQMTPLKIPDIEAWLARAVHGMNDEIRNKVQELIADLIRRKDTLDTAIWWHHPHHDKSLVELHLYAGEQANESELPYWPDKVSSRILLVFEPTTLTIVGVPQRFFEQDDHKNVIHVSDLDEDGNFEVWWAESFRKCHGDETDLERDIDCSAKSADMGEVNGDVLTYFANSLLAKKRQKSREIRSLNTELEAVVMPANEVSRDDDRSCNKMLIGAVLEKKLAISFRERHEDGDIISLVCKAHPVHPEKTLVALFHDLAEQQNASGLDQKGFVFAVIDVKQRKIHSLYRDSIEEDASIRIDEYSLQFDTARYNLAPGVRALGVRMNIGHGPRCAEGGENNYLTLFVEEGKKLRPVLKGMPMSSWSIVEGSNSCGDADTAYTMDHVGLTLSIAPTSTEGWYDLEVVAHHQLEIVDPVEVEEDAEAPSSTSLPAKKQILSKLRAHGKKYSSDSGLQLAIDRVAEASNNPKLSHKSTGTIEILPASSAGEADINKKSSPALLLPGIEYKTGAGWWVLSCEATCKISKTKLSVTPQQYPLHSGTTIPGQKLVWSPIPPGAALLFFKTAVGASELKFIEKVIESYHPIETRQPLDGSASDIEVILHGEIKAKLLPVLVLPDTKADQSRGVLTLEFRTDNQRQTLTQENFNLDRFFSNPEAYVPWVGDLDGDGKLDLILNMSRSKSCGATVALLLSSFANPGELLGEAGRFDCFSVE